MRNALWIIAMLTPFVWAEVTLEMMSIREVEKMQAQLRGYDKDFVSAIQYAESGK